MTQWHSEYGQDKWLAENIFNHHPNGVFVEAGAMDGLMHSNSLYFEEMMDWTGVLVEPNPLVMDRLRTNRPDAQIVNCALSNTTGSGSFMAIEGGLFGWSALSRKIDSRREHAYETMVPQSRRKFVTVDCKPLADVLRECKVTSVDYLSLDVEGCEFDVLRNYPFDEIPIDVIGVEDNFGDNEILKMLLTERGYHHLIRVGVDDIWRRNG